LFDKKSNIEKLKKTIPIFTDPVKTFTSEKIVLR
jgi:hypothetical protein